MAMVVKNNLSAEKTLNVLNANTTALQDSLAKVSSGMKINSAKDDAANFAISEKMREQIRSLEQGSQNVQNGSSMLKVAQGGVDNIVEELRNLKELAINAANDTNTDNDRATLQKTFEQKMANINDIATATSYNGKTLIDGSYAVPTSSKTGGEAPGKIPVTTTIFELEKSIYAMPTLIKPGEDITEDGAYMLDPDYVFDNTTVNVKANNVKIVNSWLANDSYTNLCIDCSSMDSNVNLWIDELTITNTEDKSAIKFGKGTNNVLKLAGMPGTASSFSLSGNSSYTSAVINVGGGLTIEGSEDIIADSMTRSLQVYSSGMGAAIGTDGKLSSADDENSTAEIKIGTGVYIYAQGVYGAAIGSGANNSIGDITIGNKGGEMSAISWTHHDGTYTNNYAVIGAGDFAAYAIGEGAGGSVGSVKIASECLDNGYFLNSDSNYYSPSTTFGSYSVPFSNLEEPTSEGYVEKTITTYVDSASFQFGGNSNQSMNFFISDMHTKQLGTGHLINNDGTFALQEDLDRYIALGNGSDSTSQTDLQAEWLATVTDAAHKTVDDIDITTKHNANVAIRVLDGAIDYALDESTRLGAYLQRLEYTEANVTVMGENVQAAESTIRDADMAKEMTAYTKNNVLVQSAQSMLAQANQNSSAVLSLLQ